MRGNAIWNFVKARAISKLLTAFLTAEILTSCEAALPSMAAPSLPWLAY